MHRRADSVQVATPLPAATANVMDRAVQHGANAMNCTFKAAGVQIPGAKCNRAQCGGGTLVSIGDA